jgi:tRNA1(Val) A37 N6-methylase TrmN6
MKVFLYQSPNGYCYNSDSIFLYNFAREFKLKGNILDIGCGVGTLTALLAKDFKANFYCVEKQTQMYLYAKKNFQINKIKAKITNCDFKDYKSDIKFDFIISNPPFYRVDRHQSPNISKNIARYEHHLPLNLLISKSSKLLKPKGYFIFCYDASLLDEILVELKRASLSAEFLKFVHPKANKEAKIVMITARNGSKSRCKVLEPLIVFNSNNEYNIKAKEAFKNANTHSIKAEFEKS